jgi:hypothetical protein
VLQARKNRTSVEACSRDRLSTRCIGPWNSKNPNEPVKTGDHRANARMSYSDTLIQPASLIEELRESSESNARCQKKQVKMGRTSRLHDTSVGRQPAFDATLPQNC